LRRLLLLGFLLLRVLLLLLLRCNCAQFCTICLIQYVGAGCAEPVFVVFGIITFVQLGRVNRWYVASLMVSLLTDVAQDNFFWWLRIAIITDTANNVFVIARLV
jgi:hypothetical protein